MVRGVNFMVERLDKMIFERLLPALRRAQGLASLERRGWLLCSRKEKAVMTMIGCSANSILASLPSCDFERLAPKMKLAELRQGQEINWPGESIKVVYFPLDCVVSVVCSMENGATAEVMGVGAEGLVGGEALMGELSAFRVARVAVEGYAVKLALCDLAEEVGRRGELSQRVLRHEWVCKEMALQNLACAKFHSIAQQLSKWLLLALDRHKSPQMKITHDSLGQALGVRRESVTAAAGEMRRRGWLKYSRGCLDVVDRKGLESQACECYAASRELMARLLPS